MARKIVGFAIWGALLLAPIAIAQAQCLDCQCSTYPDFAYNPSTMAPIPGESPSSYFTRQYHRSRGPYGEFATQYEVFPEPWEADLPKDPTPNDITGDTDPEDDDQPDDSDDSEDSDETDEREDADDPQEDEDGADDDGNE